MIEAKAKIVDVSADWNTGKMKITFEFADRVNPEGLMNRDVRVKASEWREKRSLNANAYFYVLAGKIAEKLRISLTEAHNRLIAMYGQMEGATIIMRDDIDWMSLDYIHLKPTPATRSLDDGRLYRVYFVMRGSHTYDTKEMSRLIDGTVEDAKELGIETMTPDQLEELKSKWQRN